ncbi:hypothetical protein D3C75_1209800 [compost metagenome]
MPGSGSVWYQTKVGRSVLNIVGALSDPSGTAMLAAGGRLVINHPELDHGDQILPEFFTLTSTRIFAPMGTSVFNCQLSAVLA